MKFEYDDDEYRGECVAYLHNMEGEGYETASLAIKVGAGQVVTLYHSGDSIYQKDYEDDCGDDMIKKFYPGDKMTITF